MSVFAIQTCTIIWHRFSCLFFSFCHSLSLSCISFFIWWCVVLFSVFVSKCLYGRMSRIRSFLCVRVLILYILDDILTLSLSLALMQLKSNACTYNLQNESWKDCTSWHQQIVYWVFGPVNVMHSVTISIYMCVSGSDACTLHTHIMPNIFDVCCLLFNDCTCWWLLLWAKTQPTRHFSCIDIYSTNEFLCFCIDSLSFYCDYACTTFTHNIDNTTNLLVFSFEPFTFGRYIRIGSFISTI